MVNYVLSEIFQLPRFAAGSALLACLIWYRSDGYNEGLWICLLALATFAAFDEAILSGLSHAAKRSGDAAHKETNKMVSVALKALGASSGTLSSLFASMFVAVIMLGSLATIVRMLLPVRSQNWWSCVAVLLIALNTVAALSPTILMTAYRWSKTLWTFSPDLASPAKLLNSLHTSSIILDSNFLDRESAKQDLAALKQAQVQVLFVESRDGPDAEKAMSETILLGEDGKSLPLVVKLRTVLDAKETEEHPCRDVYILLNDSPVAVVSGIRTASEIEQLCHLCQLDYGRFTAVLAADDRYLSAACVAALALIPDRLVDQHNAHTRSRAGVALFSDSPSAMLLFLTKAKSCKENFWKAASYVMVLTVLFAAPAVISIALGLPLLLPPARLLALSGCAYLGAMALAYEPIELDVPYQPYSHIFTGIPSEAETDREVLSGRWVSYLLQCMLLSFAACIIAVIQTLKDAGCGSIQSILMGTCDVHAKASQHIRLALPLPDGGWGGTAQLCWEGSILDSVQGVVFCMTLSLTGWLLLVHKTHRVAMFNTFIKDRSFILSPSFVLFLVYNFLATGLAFSGSVRSAMGVKKFVPLYALFSLPVVAFILLESEMRKFAVVGQGRFYSRHPLLK
eukprot:jgi/Ulvmu1/3509/UM162_0016.1